MSYAPLTITVDREVPSQNKTMWKHWRAYTAERDAWFLHLRAKLVPIARVTCPVRAELVSLRGRLLDFSNLVGGAKPIPDCLKRLGYIHDDAPRWFTCFYLQEQVPAIERRTRISLTPILD